MDPPLRSRAPRLLPPPHNGHAPNCEAGGAERGGREDTFVNTSQEYKGKNRTCWPPRIHQTAKRRRQRGGEERETVGGTLQKFEEEKNYT